MPAPKKSASTGKKFTTKKTSSPKKTPLPTPEYSDAKYILVLFILALIVVVFGILVYIFSQSPVERARSGSQPTFQESVLDAKERMHEEEEREASRLVDELNDISSHNDAETKTGVNTATVDEPIESETISRSFTLPPDFDPSRYNPRDDMTRSLYGLSLIRKYFEFINTKDYKSACSLTSSTICNARRDLFAFENFLSQIDGGYTIENIYEAREQKDDEKIYCVVYTYKLVADLNPTPITELFQYRVRMRPDGADEISARVCEKVMKDGRDRPCPIKTPKKYCDV